MKVTPAKSDAPDEDATQTYTPLTGKKYLSVLALRTEMRAAAADGDLLDGPAAGGARLACAVVDAEVLLMAAVAARTVAVVAEGRAAVGEAVAEDALDGRCELLALCLGQAAGLVARMDPCEKQGLVGVDVAEPRDAALVKQEGLDRLFPAADGLREVRRRERVRQGLRPERLEARHGDLFACGKAVDAAEGAHVGKDERTAAREVKDHSRVGVALLAGRVVDEAARHAQVEDDGAAILQVEQQVLAAAPHAFHALARDERLERLGLRIFQLARQQDVGAGDRAVRQLLIEILADDLHLGQLWHRNPSSHFASAQLRPQWMSIESGTESSTTCSIDSRRMACTTSSSLSTTSSTSSSWTCSRMRLLTPASLSL